jgi:circadian locomoter output cycles kaput protein
VAENFPINKLIPNLPQNDLLHSTIYDIVYEEEHQEIYNILLNPPKTAIEPHQCKISNENQICFLAHLKRGSFENPPKILYEYVQFTGYFSKFEIDF